MKVMRNLMQIWKKSKEQQAARLAAKLISV